MAAVCTMIAALRICGLSVIPRLYLRGLGDGEHRHERTLTASPFSKAAAESSESRVVS
jgi:hypothetical protein